MLVDVAGDVACRSTSEVWFVDVTHPDDPDLILAVVDVRDAAIATSRQDVGGRVVDPSTGDGARGARQATVVGPDGAVADALATALFVAGTEGAAWFRQLPAWSALVLDERGVTRWGHAFPGW